MSAKILNSPKINLFDKEFLGSRIACLTFIGLLISYIVGTTGIIALLICSSLILFFAIQFVIQSQVLNAILGGIMFLLGVYFSMAVWSEFNDFQVVNKSAKQLLIMGWGGCFTVIAFGVIMVRSAVLHD